MEELEEDSDSGSWNKFINGDELKIWYRKREGGMFDFYCEKNIDAPIQNVICVIKELETFK